MRLSRRSPISVPLALICATHLTAVVSGQQTWLGNPDLAGDSVFSSGISTIDLTENDFGYGVSFTLLQPDTPVRITRLGVYLPTNPDDCRYTLSIYDESDGLLLGRKALAQHAGKDQLSQVVLDNPVVLPDEHAHKYVVAVSVSGECTDALYQANRNPQDNDWDVQQGFEWIEPHSDFLDNQDAGFCGNDGCSHFQATGHPQNYFVLVGYDLDADNPNPPVPQTVENGPFECNGRDTACRFSRELNNWICEYDFRVSQAYTMRRQGQGGPNSDSLWPYPVAFPVKTRDDPNSDFSELYFMNCSANQYLMPEEVGDECSEVVLESANAGGSLLHTGEEPDNVIVLDGVPRRVSTINGQIPAPTLCVGYGDTIRVNVINDMRGFGGYETTALHWHGMFQRDTFWMDGPSMLTQCPIHPNARFSYEFKAEPAGTYWYHSHSGVQIADGMFGALVVLQDPDKEAQLYGDMYDVDEPDQIVMLADWEHESYQGVMLKRPGHWIDEDTGLPVLNPISPEDGGFASGHPWNSGHINGHGSFGGNKLKPYVFNVKPGKRVRFRVISAAAAFAFRVSVDNHNLTIIAIDGLDVQPVTVDGFITYMAERFDFVLHADQGAAGEDFYLRAETLSGDGEILAIVHYDTEPGANPVTSNPTTVSVFESKCQDEACLVANCPWPERYRTNPNIACLTHADFRRNRDQDEDRNPSQEALPDVQAALDKGNVIPLNFNILGDVGRQTPNVEGIFGTLPTTPPFLRDGEFEDRCAEGSEGSFDQCGHVYELEHGETYIFVLTNRWPAVPNQRSPANFPGAQTHPVHMHGHSFYVLAESAGTIRDPAVSAERQNGCQNGVGFAGDFSHYCYDQETIDGDFVCNAYWGNCTFVDDRFPDLLPIEEAPQKDTIPIPVHGWVVIAIVADNPGWWFMHCHIDAHVAEGMNIVLSEAPEKTRELVDNDLPRNFPSCASFDLPARS